MRSKDRPFSSEKLEKLNEELPKFLEKLKFQRRLLASSVKIYEIEIRALLRKLETQSFESAQEELANLKPSTHRRKLLIWQNFFSFARSPLSELLKAAPKPKIRSRQPNFLTEEEIFQLEAAAFRGRNIHRDRLLIGLGVQLGLRLAEILSLRWKDVEGEWIRVMRKGQKEQRLPLLPSLQVLFKTFQRESLARPEDFVFPGRTKESLGARAAQKIIEQLGRAAGLSKKLSPHALRHSFATRLAARGVSLASLKELLGHQSLQTTERYLHVTPEHLRDAINLSGRGWRKEPE